MNNDDLLISKTTLPEKELPFNDLSMHIVNTLKEMYGQSKKFLHEEQKLFASGGHKPIDYAAVLGR